MTTPKAIKQQPGYIARKPWMVDRTKAGGGARLYVWIDGGWRDASLRDRPELEAYIGRESKTQPKVH